jgi:hypothetical protein
MTINPASGEDVNLERAVRVTARLSHPSRINHRSTISSSGNGCTYVQLTMFNCNSKNTASTKHNAKKTAQFVGNGFPFIMDRGFRPFKDVRAAISPAQSPETAATAGSVRESSRQTSITVAASEFLSSLAIADNGPTNCGRYS